MIIDAILDRRAGAKYSEKTMRYMYDEAILFGYDGLARSLDGGVNGDIVRELCNYIDESEYNPDIKEFVKSQNWMAA